MTFNTSRFEFMSSTEEIFLQRFFLKIFLALLHNIRFLALFHNIRFLALFHNIRFLAVRITTVYHKHNHNLYYLDILRSCTTQFTLESFSTFIVIKVNLIMTAYMLLYVVDLSINTSIKETILQAFYKF